MKDALESASNYGQAQAIVRQHFFSVRPGEMAPFADACTDLIGKLRNPIAIPATFGYAARARMHDASNWVATEHQAALPSEFLISALNSLLDRPRAIECRRNYYWGLVDGLTHYISGNIDAAWKRFALTAQAAESVHVFQADDMAGGIPFARCFPSPSDLEHPRSRRFPREPGMVKAPRKDRRLTFMISVDPIYAEAFAPLWIDTLSRIASAGIAFHIHVTSRQAASTAALERILELAGHAGIDVSLSLDPTAATDRAYFTCSRFLSALRVMDAAGSPLLLCDADLILSDPEALAERGLPLLQSERGCRAIVNSQHGHGYLPWRHVSASLLFVANDPEGRSFIDAACRFIEYFWDDSLRTNWWIDQLALESARQHLIRQTGSDDACRRIPDGVRRLFVTPPHHKAARLSLVPEVRALIETGNTLSTALDVLARRAVA